MKKVVSSILICSTLFSCVTPKLNCNAEDEKTAVISQNTKDNLNNTENEELKNTLELTNDKEAIQKEELKKVILELANDKKFTDQVIKNYTESRKDPIWLRVLKAPFKACWYLIKKAFDYTVGKASAEFIENKVLPIVITFLTGLVIYKKFPWVKKGVDWFVSFFRSSKVA